MRHAQSWQKQGVVCAAFCEGSLAGFLDRAIAATAALCRSPLWENLPCAATLGASAGRYRATTPDELLGQLDSWMRSNPVSLRSLFAYELCAGEDPFNPEQCVAAVADADAEHAHSPVRHLFEARLVSSALAPSVVGATVDRLLEILEMLPLESAYVSPALSWTRSPLAGRPDARHAAPAFANRALDIHVNSATRFKIGQRCRGARWLVVLKRSLVDRMGGEAALAGLRCAGLRITPKRNAIAIQVNDAPLETVFIDTPLFARYRALATYLEEATYFDDLDLQRARFNGNVDALDRYERRFMS